MPKNKAVPKNVSLYPADWETVKQVAERMGLGQLSPALRFIINDWLRLKQTHEKSPLPEQRAA